MDPRGFLPECRVFLPDVFLKRYAPIVTMCLKMKNIDPKHVQGFEPEHSGTFSGQHMCQPLHTLLIFARIQAKAGVVR